MFAWLNGPGRAFREPLKGSTNYLGAYDREGVLQRSKGQDAEGGAEKEPQKTEEELAEEEEGLDEAEKEQRREAREAAAAAAAEASPSRPKERSQDLRPFPNNTYFTSQSVLSEELREQLWSEVVEKKHSVSTVSAVYGVDMRRVGAVVRLKTVEKEWIAKNKQLATPYASAVLAMLPQTQYINGKITPHESINDLPVHPYTRQQIFYPTSESRQFTRADAAKVFSPTLLPADDRIPHPELIELERDAAMNVSREVRTAKVQAKDERRRKEKEAKERKQQEWAAKNLQTVDGQRWAFKFENINVEHAGNDGRSKSGVGWRYGNPHQDRRRGAVKIPTVVE
ncbi:hypothetical protein MBLNU459_g0517t1 [Dothideomycetes sp. NU459]